MGAEKHEFVVGVGKVPTRTGPGRGGICNSGTNKLSKRFRLGHLGQWRRVSRSIRGRRTPVGEGETRISAFGGMAPRTPRRRRERSEKPRARGLAPVARKATAAAAMLAARERGDYGTAVQTCARRATTASRAGGKKNHAGTASGSKNLGTARFPMAEGQGLRNVRRSRSHGGGVETQHRGYGEKTTRK